MNISSVAFVLFAAASLWWDLRYRRLPNGWLLAGAATAAAMHGVDPSAVGWSAAASGAAVGLAFGAALYAVKAVGAGDAKWFGAAGAFVGPQSAALLVAASVAIAGVAAAIGLAASPELRRRWMETVAGIYVRVGFERLRLPERGTTKFPFLLCAAPAAVAVALWKMH